MDHHSAATDGRSASEIIADARLLQGRHASDAFGAAARWMKEAVARLGGEPAKLEERRLTVH